MKCLPRANNNREAVVVCARYVVKRPSKRLRASTIKTQLEYVYMCVYIYSGTPRIGAPPPKRTAPRYEGVQRYAGF